MVNHLTRLQTNALQDLGVLMLTELHRRGRRNAMTTNLLGQIKQLLGRTPKLMLGKPPTRIMLKQLSGRPDTLRFATLSRARIRGPTPF